MPTAKQSQAKTPPMFRRLVYDFEGQEMSKRSRLVPACACNHAMPKSRAKAAICANCAAAILTALEKTYIKALPK
jgi:hypothetical protein